MKKKNIFMGCLVIVVFIFFAFVTFVTLTADTSCDTTEPKSMMGKIKLCYNNNWEDYSYVQEIITAEQKGAQSFQQQLFQVAITCQQIPLTMSNQTINLIAIECLKNEG